MLVSEFKYDKPKKYDHLSLVCHFTIPLNIRLKLRVSSPLEGLILVTIRRTSALQDTTEQSKSIHSGFLYRYGHHKVIYSPAFFQFQGTSLKLLMLSSNITRDLKSTKQLYPVSISINLFTKSFLLLSWRTCSKSTYQINRKVDCYNTKSNNLA